MKSLGKESTTTLLQHLEAASLEVHPTHAHAFPYHDMPCYAVHKAVTKVQPDEAEQSGHCCPSRKLNSQIRQAKIPRHSDFPDWSCSPSLLRYRLPACGGESSAIGNVISSMIQRLTKNAPSHAHGVDMDQHLTAHDFPFGIDVSSDSVHRLLRTQAIEKMHVPGEAA